MPGSERKKKKHAATSAPLGEYWAVYEQGESSTSIVGPSNGEDVATLGEFPLMLICRRSLKSHRLRASLIVLLLMRAVKMLDQSSCLQICRLRDPFKVLQLKLRFQGCNQAARRRTQFSLGIIPATNLGMRIC